MKRYLQTPKLTCERHMLDRAPTFGGPIRNRSLVAATKVGSRLSVFALRWILMSRPGIGAADGPDGLLLCSGLSTTCSYVALSPLRTIMA